jgi:phage shock protein PspC (stress-responsive transcriptional regulator)
MENETTTTAGTSSTETEAPDLVRPRQGRVLAGVSQGLANRFDLPNWVPRALFVVTAFFGGLGLALYAAGWALIRSEDENESPAERFFEGASSTKSWIGIGLIFVAALILLENLTFFSGGVVFAAGLLIVGVLLYLGHIPLESSGNKSKEGVQPMTTPETLTPDTETDTTSGASPAGGGTPPTPTPTPPILPPSAAKPRERSILGRITIGVMLLGLGLLAIFDNIEGVPVYAEPRHYLALAVAILGLGLLVGAFVGRARWLILVAVFLVPTLLFSPVFEYEWNSDQFEAVHQPTSFEDIEPLYTLDLGNLVIDLSELPWDGETVHINAHVDAGNLEIRIPDGVGLVGNAAVDIGHVGAPGRESSGLGNPNLDFDDPGDNGTVNLDATVDLGNIEIQR